MDLANNIVIVYEDDHVLVIAKPAGLVVNRAESQKDETLEAWLEETYHIPAERSGIVHRLDKDTSGVLVIAKSQEALSNLQQQFFDRTTKKTYVALCHGLFGEPQGVITEAISRSQHNRTKFAVSTDGRPSETHYQVTAKYTLPLATLEAIMATPANDREQPQKLNKNQKRYLESGARDYSLLELNPRTGRTHQIRVHLVSLRHPIVSDKVYTGRKLVKFDLLWCPRQFLHAQSLAFDHPVSGKPITCTAPLPADLQSALLYLQSA